MARVNRVALGENDRSLDAVLQLAHVARPRVGRAARRSPTARAPAASCSGRGRTLDEVLREHRDVAGPIAQRRNRDRKHREPEVRDPPGTDAPPRPPSGCGSWPRRRGRRPASDAVPPTRSKRFSSSARRILAWSGSGRSPISSRKSVPRWASSNLPGLRAAAPVNAPFSWPKSSVSSRFSGIAAQLIATNGPSARGLSTCSARANSSLPVPLSPSRSTVASVAAARCSATVTCFSSGSSPTICGAPAPRRQLLVQQDVLGRQPALRERTLDHQQQMVGIDRLGEEVERAFLHRRHRVLKLPNAVITMTGSSGSSSLAARSTPSRRRRAAADPTARRPGRDERRTWTASG